MTYSTSQANQIVRDSDGAVIPTDPSNMDYVAYLEWVGAGNTITPIDLSFVKQQQIILLSASCEAAINAGFTSSALGSAYTYPAKINDQINLASSVLASLLPNIATDWSTPFWCCDADGNWAFLPHTAAQIQTVGDDGKTAILIAMGKNQTLATQVAAATTAEAVTAITW